MVWVPSGHFSMGTDETDDEGRHKFMGFVVEFGEYRIYHSGDTLWHDTLVKEVRRWPINLAFLPINGNRPGKDR